MKKNSKSNSCDLIVNLANRIAMERKFNSFGKKFSSAEIKKSTKEIRKIISNGDNKHFVSYGIENGKVLYLWVSKVVKDHFEGKIIMVNPFRMNSDLINNGCLRRIIVQAREFHKTSKLKLQILIPPSEKEKIPLYEKVGFKISFHQLSSKVKDSLKYLITKKKKLPIGYEIKELDPKENLEKYIKMETKALKSDKTSAVYHFPVKKIEKISLKYRQDNKAERRYWGLYYKDKLIGGSSVSIMKSPVKIGLFASIAVLPLHRGRGFSANLWYEGLVWLKERKIERYVAVSSTERVLSRINRMKINIATTCMRA